jgi:HK97 family phage major capsid protein
MDSQKLTPEEIEERKFRGLMSEMDALKARETLTPEEGAAFKAKLIEAQASKSRIEDLQAAAALKAWESASAGSAVKAGFGMEPVTPTGDSYTGWSGEAIMPNEGNLPGMKMTPVSTRYDPTTREWSATGGELVPVTKEAERKLKVMNSGEYKDALVASLRAKASGTNLAAKHMKIIQEGVDASGGFWVSPDMRTQIVQKQAGITGVSNNVFSFQAGSNMVTFPAVSYTTHNTATTGISFSWTAEAPAANISESTNPTASRINIPVHTATACLLLTREEMEDSMFDLLGFVSEKIGEAFALGMNNAYINGTGVGQPQGILAATNATVAHSFTTGAGGMYVPSGVSAAVTWVGTAVGTPESGEGFVGVERALPAQYEQNAKWYASKDTFAQARSLVDTTGRPFWMDQYPNFQNGYLPNILGYPIVKDAHMPIPAANSYSVAFGDLKGYYAPQRVGMTIEVIRELFILRGLVGIYARQRVGGQLVEDWRVKLMKLATS